MERTSIDQLIINTPYDEPEVHWSYNRERQTFFREEGRRPAGYLIASGASRVYGDPGVFVEIPLVNRIRPRVKAWRNAGYPGVTAITKRLLGHWSDQEEFENRRFFFCQLEAVETLIWLAEAADSERVGIDIPGDGGEFQRLCAATHANCNSTFTLLHRLQKMYHVCTDFSELLLPPDRLTLLPPNRDVKPIRNLGSTSARANTRPTRTTVTAWFRVR